MNARSRWVMVAVILLSTGVSLSAQNSLSFDSTIVDDFVGASSTLTVDSDQPIESIFLAFSYDPTLAIPADIDAIGPAEMAEGLFVNVLPGSGGIVLGLIVDAEPPFDGQTIPEGASQDLLQVTWIPTALVNATVSFDLTFIDGVFDSPPVTNTITQAGGIVITAAQGLLLTNGLVSLVPVLPPTLEVAATEIAPIGNTDVAIELTNPTGPIAAISWAIPFPPELMVLGVTSDGSILEILQAEFLKPTIEANGAALEAVLDVTAPFDGQTIALGNWQVGSVRVNCTDPPLAPNPAVSFTITPTDGVVGNPAINNHVTITGIELTPQLNGGELTCTPVPLSEVTFQGGLLEGEEVIPISAAPGVTVEYLFFYTDPIGGIQGLQIAACTDCTAEFVSGSWSAIGYALDEAEFLNVTYDIDSQDGDGCQITLGVLLDSLPPFDNATLPVTTVPIALGSVQIAIDSDAAPLSCLPIEFCDDIDGAGGPLVSNLVIIESEGLFNFTRTDGLICLDLGIQFRRGDINQDATIDLADPILILLYLKGQASPSPCTAAADSDGNGTIELNDPLILLQYLFINGSPPTTPFETCLPALLEDCQEFNACP